MLIGCMRAQAQAHLLEAVLIRAAIGMEVRTQHNAARLGAQGHEPELVVQYGAGAVLELVMPDRELLGDRDALLVVQSERRRSTLVPQHACMPLRSQHPASLFVKPAGMAHARLAVPAAAACLSSGKPCPLTVFPLCVRAGTG